MIVWNSSSCNICIPITRLRSLFMLLTAASHSPLERRACEGIIRNFSRRRSWWSNGFCHLRSAFIFIRSLLALRKLVPLSPQIFDGIPRRAIYRFNAKVQSSWWDSLRTWDGQPWYWDTRTLRCIVLPLWLQRSLPKSVQQRPSR